MNGGYMILPSTAALAIAVFLNGAALVKTADEEGNHAKGWWLTHVTKYPNNNKLRVFIHQYHTYGECMVQKDIDPTAVKMKEVDEKESRSAYFMCISNPFDDSGESDL